MFYHVPILFIYDKWWINSFNWARKILNHSSKPKQHEFFFILVWQRWLWHKLTTQSGTTNYHSTPRVRLEKQLRKRKTKKWEKKWDGKKFKKRKKWERRTQTEIERGKNQGNNEYEYTYLCQHIIKIFKKGHFLTLLVQWNTTHSQEWNHQSRSHVHGFTLRILLNTWNLDSERYTIHKHSRTYV